MAAPHSRPHAESIGLIEAIARQLRGAISASLPEGVSHAEFQVLQQLGDGREMAPGELARAIHLSKGALTPILQRLEARGLAQLAVDDADHRRKRTQLTALGVETYAAAVRALRPSMQKLQARVSESDLSAALPVLRRLEVALDDLSPPGEPAGARRREPR